jgi:NAD(P)-dependent dehydrogenase (short-subunit alcohol dehydrogenase family)
MNSALSETPVNLTGQVALVTGGGRGLGRAFALALAGAGAQVAVTARTAAQLAETVQLIERAGGCGPGDSWRCVCARRGGARGDHHRAAAWACGPVSEQRRFSCPCILRL